MHVDAERDLHPIRHTAKVALRAFSKADDRITVGESLVKLSPDERAHALVKIALSNTVMV